MEYRHRIFSLLTAELIVGSDEKNFNFNELINLKKNKIREDNCILDLCKKLFELSGQEQSAQNIRDYLTNALDVKKPIDTLRSDLTDLNNILVKIHLPRS